MRLVGLHAHSTIGKSAPRAPVQGRYGCGGRRKQRGVFQMQEDYRLFVGIDWGPEHITGGSPTRPVRASEIVGLSHSGAGLQEFADWIVELAHGQVDEVAGSRVRCRTGPSSMCSSSADVRVFALNPKQLDRFRDRFSSEAREDDPRDAEVLSSALRDGPARVSAADARGCADHPVAREFSRQDTELGEDLRRLTNRLRDHLLRTWPELLGWSRPQTNRGCGPSSNSPRRRMTAGDWASRRFGACSALTAFDV